MSTTRPQFVVCLRNEGYRASLEPRKLYRSIPDPEAESEGLLRIIDESGEDYLFPEHLFVPVPLSGKAEKALLGAS